MHAHRTGAQDPWATMLRLVDFFGPRAACVSEASSLALAGLLVLFGVGNWAREIKDTRATAGSLTYVLGDTNELRMLYIAPLLLLTYSRVLRAVHSVVGLREESAGVRFMAGLVHAFFLAGLVLIFLAVVGGVFGNYSKDDSSFSDGARMAIGIGLLFWAFERVGGTYVDAHEHKD